MTPQHLYEQVLEQIVRLVLHIPRIQVIEGEDDERQWVKIIFPREQTCLD